ncbi:unnamed protein product [Lampetra fluviatilis]
MEINDTSGPIQGMEAALLGTAPGSHLWAPERSPPLPGPRRQTPLGRSFRASADAQGSGRAQAPPHAPGPELVLSLPCIAPSSAGLSRAPRPPAARGRQPLGSHEFASFATRPTRRACTAPSLAEGRAAGDRGAPGTRGIRGRRERREICSVLAECRLDDGADAIDLYQLFHQSPWVYQHCAVCCKKVQRMTAVRCVLEMAVPDRSLFPQMERRRGTGGAAAVAAGRGVGAAAAASRSSARLGESRHGPFRAEPRNARLCKVKVSSRSGSSSGCLLNDRPHSGINQDTGGRERCRLHEFPTCGAARVAAAAATLAPRRLNGGSVAGL